MDALRSELPSNRMEGIAVLPAFLRYAGCVVGGETVDPVASLIAALTDPEELLRADARAALEALDDPRAKAAIEGGT